MAMCSIMQYRPTFYCSTLRLPEKNTALIKTGRGETDINMCNLSASTSIYNQS